MFNISANNSLPLNNKLQQWIVPYPLRQMRHRWYYSKDSDKIYQPHIKYVRYFIKKQGTLTYTLNADSKELSLEPPLDAIPISSMQEKYFFVHKAFFNTPTSSLNFNSLQKHIEIIPQ